MSFDIFLACCRGETTAHFKRSLFEAIFCRHAIDPHLPLAAVTYPDGGADIYGGEADEIEHLMFNHCGGDTFFAALYELALRTQSIVWWPSAEPAVAVPDPAVLGYLPATMRNSKPHIVRNGRELENSIFGPR